MARNRLARIAMVGVLAGCLVGVPVLGLTETRPERAIKSRLGLIGPSNCQPTRPSPGWSTGAELPDDRDEPRAVAIDGMIYLAGGIAQIVDYGDPSDVPGVDERVEVESLANLTRFDPRTDEYEELPPMPEPLNHIGMVAHGDDIYVVGGHGELLGGAEPKRTLYRYSIPAGKWSRLADMPTARGAVAAGVIGDRLYVAGGLARGRALPVLEAYDLRTGGWERLEDMPSPREHVASAVLGGRLYVVGGRNEVTDSLSTVERYDPAADRWKRLPDLPVPAGGLEAVAFDGTILALGGGDDRRGTVTGAVQRFDPEAGRWSELQWMRSPRHGFAAALLGDRVYTFGGSPCPLFAASDIVDVFEPRNAS